MGTVLMTHMTHTQGMTQDGDNVINHDDFIPVLRHPAASSCVIFSIELLAR